MEHLARRTWDCWGARSQQRAAQATPGRDLDHEIIEIPIRDDEGNDTDETIKTDEGIRPDTTVEGLAVLEAGLQGRRQGDRRELLQITDGASGTLIMSEERAAALGYTPRARFVAFTVTGDDPVKMLTAPIPATRMVLERAKLTIDDIDAIEINEAFASVILAWEKEIDPDMNKVNVNGGAIALGHPLGASGAKLLATLLNELERTNGRYGLLTMCEGGGLANATIIERLS